MNLSRRITALAPSATLAMSAKAAMLKAQGKDIISLSVGEPDFPTPDHIGEAGKQAIDNHFTRYTAEPGIVELRAAVAEYFTGFYHVNAAAENVIITNGGKQGLYNVFMALLDPGDEVLVPAPYWVSYPAMVELAEGVPVVVPATADAGFKITLDDLERRRTPKTKAMVLNSPSNPTGACYTREETDAIAQWCLDNKVILVADEIYDQLVYAPARFSSVAPWWVKHPDNFVIIGGVSKTFAMTGWRVGHVLADPDFIKAMGRFQSQTTSNVCSIAQKAALAAYKGGFAVVDEMRVAFQRRRDLAMSCISTWRDVVCPKPDGAFYIFPDVHRLFNARFPDAFSLCEQLLDKAGVALVPGTPFGDKDCIRISYAVSDATLTEALDRVSRFLYA